MTIYEISEKYTSQSNRRMTKNVNLLSNFFVKEESDDFKYISQDSVCVVSGRLNKLINSSQDADKEIEKIVLKLKGNKLVNCLKTIRAGLLNSEFEECDLHNINFALDKLSDSVKSMEIQKIIENTKLKAQVELAKIEKTLLNK